MPCTGPPMLSEESMPTIYLEKEAEVGDSSIEYLYATLCSFEFYRAVDGQSEDYIRIEDFDVEIANGNVKGRGRLRVPSSLDSKEIVSSQPTPFSEIDVGDLLQRYCGLNPSRPNYVFPCKEVKRPPSSSDALVNTISFDGAALAALRVGDFVDVQSLSDGRWYRGLILRKSAASGADRIQVRYCGWGKKYDEWVELSSLRIMRDGTSLQYIYDCKVAQSGKVAWWDSRGIEKLVVAGGDNSNIDLDIEIDIIDYTMDLSYTAPELLVCSSKNIWYRIAGVRGPGGCFGSPSPGYTGTFDSMLDRFFCASFATFALDELLETGRAEFADVIALIETMSSGLVSLSGILAYGEFIIKQLESMTYTPFLPSGDGCSRSSSQSGLQYLSSGFTTELAARCAARDSPPPARCIRELYEDGQHRFYAAYQAGTMSESGSGLPSSGERSTSHSSSNSNNNNDDHDDDKGSNTFSCSVCGKCYTSCEPLVRHLSECDDVERMGVSDEEISDQCCFRCHSCERLSSSDELEQHRQLCSTPAASAVVMLECPGCSARFEVTQRAECDTHILECLGCAALMQKMEEEEEEEEEEVRAPPSALGGTGVVDDIDDSCEVCFESYSALRGTATHVYCCRKRLCSECLEDVLGKLGTCPWCRAQWDAEHFAQWSKKVRVCPDADATPIGPHRRVEQISTASDGTVIRTFACLYDASMSTDIEVEAIHSICEHNGVLSRKMSELTGRYADMVEAQFSFRYGSEHDDDEGSNQGGHMCPVCQKNMSTLSVNGRAAHVNSHFGDEISGGGVSGSRPVEELCVKTGKVLNYYKSQTEASMKIFGLSYVKGIGKVCRGIQGLTFGRKFRFAATPINSISAPTSNVKKPVEQLSASGRSVQRVFESIAKAAAAAGVNPRTMTDLVKKEKRVGGFIYRFPKPKTSTRHSDSDDEEEGEEEEEKVRFHAKSCRRVVQTNMKTGSFVRSYPSSSAAALALGVTSGKMSRLCLRGQPYDGHYFTYRKNEEEYGEREEEEEEDWEAEEETLYSGWGVAHFRRIASETMYSADCDLDDEIPSKCPYGCGEGPFDSWCNLASHMGVCGNRATGLTLPLALMPTSAAGTEGGTKQPRIELELAIASTPTGVDMVLVDSGAVIATYADSRTAALLNGVSHGAVMQILGGLLDPSDVLLGPYSFRHSPPQAQSLIAPTCDAPASATVAPASVVPSVGVLEHRCDAADPSGHSRVDTTAASAMPAEAMPVHALLRFVTPPSTPAPASPVLAPSSPAPTRAPSPISLLDIDDDNVPPAPLSARGGEVEVVEIDDDSDDDVPLGLIAARLGGGEVVILLDDNDDDDADAREEEEEEEEVIVEKVDLSSFRVVARYSSLEEAAAATGVGVKDMGRVIQSHSCLQGCSFVLGGPLSCPYGLCGRSFAVESQLAAHLRRCAHAASKATAASQMLPPPAALPVILPAAPALRPAVTSSSTAAPSVAAPRRTIPIADLSSLQSSTVERVYSSRLSKRYLSVESAAADNNVSPAEMLKLCMCHSTSKRTGGFMFYLGGISRCPGGCGRSFEGEGALSRHRPYCPGLCPPSQHPEPYLNANSPTATAVSAAEDVSVSLETASETPALKRALSVVEDPSLSPSKRHRESDQPPHADMGFRKRTAECAELYEEERPVQLAEPPLSAADHRRRNDAVGSEDRALPQTVAEIIDEVLKREAVMVGIDAARP